MQSTVDAANADFWNELCGTHLAKFLGIRDGTPASLRRFDDAYLCMYPYLLPLVDPRRMAGRGFSYECALMTLNEVRNGLWRDYDPEDTVRFFALRLHEAGMIKKTPNEIVSQFTDWRFLNEIKRELKA